MKTLYLDIFSGISGDMFIGALIDLGVDAHALEHELEKLRLDGYHLHVSRGKKSSIEGVKFDVHVGAGQKNAHEHAHADAPHHAHEHSHHASCITHHEEPHQESERAFAEIQKLISESALSDWVKGKSIAVFHRLAVAEGKIHGLPPEKVHFHEVGGVDSIVDIVGACIALEMLGKPQVLASPVVEGTGWIDCAHGRFPIPVPATLAILGARGIGVTQCDEPHELVTPTGAALLAEFAETFAPMSGLVAEKIGFGLGTRNNKTRPNCVRAILGKLSTLNSQLSTTLDWDSDTIVVLETNLDDMGGEVLGYFAEKAFTAGALDVFHTPVQMKKNRPGVMLTVLCVENDADKFSEMMLRETSAFGVRRHFAARRKLKREFVTVKTQHGEVTVKIGRLGGKVVQAAPEFESCKKLSEEAKIPLKEIYQAVFKEAGGWEKRSAQ